MEHRLFLLKDGTRYYKTDSFWSLSKNPEHSKTHYCPGHIPEHLLGNLSTVLHFLKSFARTANEKI